MSPSTTLSFDVLIVGAGPAGLATACRLRSRGQQLGLDLSVGVLEKAARIGGHQLSGALLDPRDLAALVPDWASRSPPLDAPVAEESTLLLTRRHALRLPVPRAWRHSGCRMVSLGRLCRWLGELAETAGVEIHPGFAAVQPLWRGEKTLAGAMTGELGRDRTGKPKPGFQPGVAVQAAVTVLAEGCRGSLTRLVAERAAPDPGRPPQTHALGFKELWHTPGSMPGAVVHTLGWPLASTVHGGGFVYHPQPDRTAVGFAVGLDYPDPLFDPLAAFQTWKSHPRIRARLAGGRPIAYGARTLTVGGWQALPDLVVDGGLRVGDGAGFFNPATLQGIGNAIRSGIAAADAILQAWPGGDFSAAALRGYPDAVAAADWGAALRQVRNVRPGFRRGRWPGLLNGAWEALSRGRSPWTLTWRDSDRRRLRPLSAPVPPPPPPVADGRVAFASSELLGLSGLGHAADQPCHLRMDDPGLPLAAGRNRFANPELRYCPARVFELLPVPSGSARLHVHAENCLHCKSCDIKDPFANIRWTPPEGGSGPDYREM